MNSDAAILAARIRSELIELERVVERAERLLSKSQDKDDDDYLDGVALNLHSFYAGTERIFEEIAREVDGTVPSGLTWQRNLLMQMSAEVPGKRPPVIERDTRNCLDEYRGFRHVIKNVYTFNLRPARLQDLVAELRDSYRDLSQDLTTFCQFLERVGTDDEG